MHGTCVTDVATWQVQYLLCDVCYGKTIETIFEVMRARAGCLQKGINWDRMGLINGIDAHRRLLAQKGLDAHLPSAWPSVWPPWPLHAPCLAPSSILHPMVANAPAECLHRVPTLSPPLQFYAGSRAPSSTQGCTQQWAQVMRALPPWPMSPPQACVPCRHECDAVMNV